MNFWTFLDRNSDQVFVLLLMVLLFVTPAAMMAAHEYRSAAPCACPGAP